MLKHIPHFDSCCCSTSLEDHIFNFMYFLAAKIKKRDDLILLDCIIKSLRMRD